jgi:uncharacterized iron-regulated membrane protein
MCVTGVLLAFERQAINLADSSARKITVTPAAMRLPIETVIAKLSGAERRSPTSVVIRPGAESAIEIAFGREYAVFADPYTGEKSGTGANRLRAFFRTMERWHRALGGAMEPKSARRSVAGAANLLFSSMCLTGAYLWWPRSWTAKRLASTLTFQRGLNGKARDWNWHHVFGIWTVVPLLFITATGAVMSYAWANNLLYRATGNQPPAQTRRALDGQQQGSAAELKGKSLDELLSIVQSRSDGWRTISFRPGTPLATFTVDHGYGGQPELRSQIVLNIHTGEVVRNIVFADNNMGQKLRVWSRFVHTGEEFGLPGQVVAALASLAGAVLVFTGLSLGIRRLQKTMATSRAKIISSEVEIAS